MKRYLFLFVILIFQIMALMSIAQESSDQTKMRPVIKSPSSAGEVTFPHQLHFEELELECKECHHETNAAKLKMPHEDYFDDFWIDCKICHHETKSPVIVRPCSNCHHTSPANIADETLSSKVVIHKRCWECHEVGKGEEASRNCKSCHK